MQIYFEVRHKTISQI